MTPLYDRLLTERATERVVEEAQAEQAARSQLEKKIARLEKQIWWLNKQTEKSLHRFRNASWTTGNRHRRSARRSVWIAKRLLAQRDALLDELEHTAIKGSVKAVDGFASVNCPTCKGAVLLNVGEGRERKTAISTQCDHCDATINIKILQATEEAA